MKQTVKIIQNGKEKEITSFVPEFEGELAIVHVSVIQRLAKFLPKVNFEILKDDFKNKVDNTKNLTEFVLLLEDELSFHHSINIIHSYKHEDKKLEKLFVED